MQYLVARPAAFWQSEKTATINRANYRDSYLAWATTDTGIAEVLGSNPAGSIFPSL
jgi:hypothetical protein